MDQQTKDTIKDLVGRSKASEALNLFGEWAELNGDSDLRNSILLQKSNVSNLRSEQLSGILTPSNIQVRRANIALNILTMLDDLRPTIAVKPPIMPVLPPNPGMKTLLFMGANPPGTPLLQLEIEHSRISAELNNTFKIEVAKFVNETDIAKLFTAKKPNIIHFSGHGKDPVTGNKPQTAEDGRGIGLPNNYKGGIVVFDKNMRSLKVIDDATLDYLFQQAVQALKIPLEVVVFNSCFSESQAKVVGRYVNYVVGTARAISDEVAIAFASGFYFALGNGETVENAFTTGKMGAVIEDIKAKDLIVLYKNGELYTPH